EHREDDQRNQHDGRALVNSAMAMRGISAKMRAMAGVFGVSVLLAGGAAILAEERHKPQPEHVEGRDEGGDYADQPKHPAAVLAGICLPENFVLAEEPGERRNSSDGKRGDGHGPEGPRDAGSEATHFPHVLLAANRMDYGPGGEEQQSLEERMRHQVENASGVRRYAACHEHVSELRNRRVGQDLLDVGLGDADGGGKKRS